MNAREPFQSREGRNKVITSVTGVDEQDKRNLSGMAPVSTRLAESFGAVPALKKRIKLEKITEIANEEHAQHAAGEGL